MKKEKNLFNLAKGKKKKGRPPKKVANNNEIHDKQEERDLRAKRKVDELLKEFESLSKVAVQKENIESGKGLSWLEEQIGILTKENERLEKEVSEAKNNYKKIYDDFQKKSSSSSEEVPNVVKLFNELQDNYIEHVKAKKRFEIFFPNFLNLLVDYFPYLNKYRKY